APATAIDTWLRPRSSQPGTADPVHDRFEDLLALLETLSARDPLLLVLEDLQWADRSSVALLVFLARNLTRERVLILGTARSDAMLTDLTAPASPFTAAVDHLVRLPGVEHLELGPLPTPAIRDLVRTLTPPPRPPAAPPWSAPPAATPRGPAPRRRGRSATWSARSPRRRARPRRSSRSSTAPRAT